MWTELCTRRIRSRLPWRPRGGNRGNGNSNEGALCPRYPKRLHKVVRRLLPECHVRFVLSDSGSSKGAALVAAVARRLAQRRQQVGRGGAPGASGGGRT